MRNAPLLPLFAIFAVALGACKATVGGGTSPDEARPNPTEADQAPGDGDAASGGDVASDGDVASEGDGEASEGDGSGDMAAGGSFATAEGGESAPSASPCPEGVSPGESFKDDCNNCRCTDDGKAMCTRMACTDGEPETGPQ